MPDGGDLTVSTGRAHFGDRPYLYIKIEDSGKEIPHEMEHLIFEPFYTTKVAEKKVGLGLSQAQKMVEDHGGFIRKEKTNGPGEAFALYLPLSPK
jgi:signal transduction histidine kinase